MKYKVKITHKNVDNNYAISDMDVIVEAQNAECALNDVLESLEMLKQKLRDREYVMYVMSEQWVEV